MSKLSPGIVVLLTLAVLAVVALSGAVVMSARHVDPPGWLTSLIGMLVAALLGLLAKSPMEAAPALAPITMSVAGDADPERLAKLVAQGVKDGAK